MSRSRKAKFGLGDIVHVYNRGAKKLPISRQKSDLWRFLFTLFYLNTTNLPRNWSRYLEQEKLFPKMIWPSSWGEKEPLVSILAFTIMPNHFHLVLKEINKGGISKFMHKIEMSHSKFINEKYKESGSLFQGTYKSVRVENDEQLRWLAYYVMIKNPFELYAGGFKKACREFEKAYKWSETYPFTSLRGYMGKKQLDIIDKKGIYTEIFDNSHEFKHNAKDFILSYQDNINKQFGLE